MTTSIEALLLHPDVSDELDDDAVADFLVGLAPRDFESTTFAAIRRVPPGYRLEWSRGTGVRLTRYWTFPDREPLVRFRDPTQYAERFRELLDVAVADRITTDRVTAHLSGGMDSTSVAASAAATMRHRGLPSESLRTITSVLGGSSGDREGELAALVADSLGVPIDVVDAATMAPSDPFTPLLVTPEPTPYQRTAAGFETARLPSLHAPITLTGVGGDALLWSSPWYWAEWIAQGRVLRVAHAFTDHVRMFRTRLHPSLRPGLRRLRRLPQRWATVERPLPAWLQPDFGARHVAPQHRFAGPVAAAARDARSLATDPIWATTSTWGDPSFTGLPVKVRHPLLDLRLVRFVAGLPPEPWLQDKHVLREAMVGRLPTQVRTRPKVTLVQALAPGRTPSANAALCDLVRATPDLDRFVDVGALVAEITEFGTDVDQSRDLRLAQPLGLAHWLTHRRRAPGFPTGLPQSGVAVV